MPAKTSRSKTSSKTTKKDAAAFMTLFHKNKSLRSKVRKGWDEAIKEGKKRGYTFSRQELKGHIKKRYGIRNPANADEPDTCICI